MFVVQCTELTMANCALLTHTAGLRM